jgi:hypothetical protein
MPNFMLQLSLSLAPSKSQLASFYKQGRSLMWKLRSGTGLLGHFYLTQHCVAKHLVEMVPWPFSPRTGPLLLQEAFCAVSTKAIFSYGWPSAKEQRGAFSMKEHDGKWRLGSSSGWGLSRDKAEYSLWQLGAESHYLYPNGLKCSFE